MPYIQCFNADAEKFEQLTKKSDQIAGLVNTKPDKVSFISFKEPLINNFVNIVLIKVDWLTRPLEYKEKLSNYLTEHFKTEDNKVMVIFNSISENYFIDGEYFN